jgi:ABC-type glutathione transport system ATPase component
MGIDAVLTVRGLSKTYVRRLWWGGEVPGTRALEGVSFTLERGRTLAVAGPSGSVKTTLARCLAGLEKPSAGDVQFAGERFEIQLIFQQPAASLNPRFSAAEVVEEPLLIQRRGSSLERRTRAASALQRVGLPAAVLDRRSHEFSGGERQRLAIARALVVEPKVIILDESLSGLDTGLQEQIAALLKDLQSELGISYVLISHDLGLAGGLAHEIAVMQSGRIVEQGRTADLLERGTHPLTRDLVAAAKVLAL